MANSFGIGPSPLAGEAAYGPLSEGLTLVIAARFASELDEDAVFWRQRALATKIFHALRIDAMVLDLDAPMGAFLNYMQPMLAAPYVDEIGRREGRLPQA